MSRFIARVHKCMCVQGHMHNRCTDLYAILKIHSWMHERGLVFVIVVAYTVELFLLPPLDQ